MRLANLRFFKDNNHQSTSNFHFSSEVFSTFHVFLLLRRFYSITKQIVGRYQKDIAKQRDVLDRVHAARQAVRGYTTVPVRDRGATAAPLRALLAGTPGKQTFNLLAQGDSWFDYPPGTDIIDCL